MGITNIIRTMKEVHPTKILLVKVGKFFQAYGKDSYIVSFLFNYQLKRVEMNVNMVGFPEVALNKVLKTLEDKNNYIDIYNKAHRYVSRKNRVDVIYEYLLNNLEDDESKEKIRKIEEILYE